MQLMPTEKVHWLKRLQKRSVEHLKKTQENNFSISFDALCQTEDRVSSYEWQPDFFFCIDDIKKYIEPNIKENFNFAVWLLQKEPKTEQEKETRRYLMNVVNSYVKGD